MNRKLLVEEADSWWTEISAPDKSTQKSDGEQLDTMWAPSYATVAHTHSANVNHTDGLLDSLCANLDGMVYRCRNDEHRSLEFISQGCCLLLGHQPEEILGNERLNRRSCYEAIIDPEDRPRVQQAINSALQLRLKFDVEYRIAPARGFHRWVSERGKGVYDVDGKLIAIEGIVQDVTKRRQALLEVERRYDGLFENAIEGIFRTTPEGQYLDANIALARIYGFNSAAELQASVHDINGQLYVEPGRRAEFMDLLRTHGVIKGFESEVYRRDGKIIWISENARVVRDEAGDPLYYEGTVQDITESKLYKKRIEQQATQDGLTGLANRSLLFERLQQFIGVAATSGLRLAVIFIDIDRFKYVNDQFGHEAGDQLLCAMAQRFKSCVREHDCVARLGGDEFVLLLSNLPDTTDVAALTERLLETIAQPVQTSSGTFNVTCSIGVALCPDDGCDAQLLVKNADSAMYCAKERGRNKCHFFTAELQQRMNERLEIEQGLSQALARDEFCMYYQPRIDLKTGAIIGAEALIRWQRSAHELVLPGRFISVAEEMGLIGAIGEWVLRATCKQNKAWQQAGLPALITSVNVSPLQFYGDDFAHSVAMALQQTDLAADRLELEVTESTVMRDAEHLIDTLCTMKVLGVRVSVDDFGTGYSCLSYLKRFPVDCLKIDRSFVKDLSFDPDSVNIVRIIVALGHSLGLRVVAEGVEDAHQLSYLRDIGCDEAQGFYFGKPMPAAEFERLVRDGCGFIG